MGAVIFVAIPNKDVLAMGVLEPLLKMVDPTDPEMKDVRYLIESRQNSSATMNYNNMWYAAVNQRKRQGITHFAMLHTDVTAAPYWLSTLYKEMNRTQVDVLTSVIPLKDHRGVTSCGICRGEAQMDGVRRFTMKEIMSLPETFTIDDLPNRKWQGIDAYCLAVNHGCMLVDFTKPWVEKMCFQVSDWINIFPTGNEEDVKIGEDGFYEGAILVPDTETEDWKMSRFFEREKLKVAITRKVPLGHIGTHEFRNDSAWGTWDTEQGDKVTLDPVRQKLHEEWYTKRQAEVAAAAKQG